jgi:glycosyltransferase involved in cell wall biosynthesis
MSVNNLSDMSWDGVDTMGFIIPPFTQIGGAERLIAEEMKYFDKQNITIHVITENISQSVLDTFNIPKSINIHIINSGGLLTRTQEIKKHTENIDLFMSHHHNRSVFLEDPLECGDKFAHIHGTAFWYQDHPGIEAHKNKTKIKSIVKNTPGHNEFHNKNFSIKEKVKSYIVESLERVSLNRFAGVFVDTDHIKNEVEAMYGVDAHVVQPGVSQSWLDSYQNIESIEMSSSDHDILCVGRLDIRNRIQLAIKSIESLSDERSDFHLTICGTGDYRDDLEKLVSKLGVEDLVTFKGFVSDERLQSYYVASDILAFPAWTPYGIVPIEGYGMGSKVVISSDAYANEVLSGKPGVFISEPTKTDFASSLNSALDTKEESSREVPTWNQYCKKKANIVRKSL